MSAQGSLDRPSLGDLGDVFGFLATEQAKLDAQTGVAHRGGSSSLPSAGGITRVIAPRSKRRKNKTEDPIASASSNDADTSASAPADRSSIMQALRLRLARQRESTGRTATPSHRRL